jgi:cell fate regulator YaaT (PSP1 superfamily)
MCCLAYEYEFYKEAKKRFPKTGTRFHLRGEEAVVIACDVLRDTLKVLLKEIPTEITIQEFEEARKGEGKSLDSEPRQRSEVQSKGEPDK